MSLDPIRTTQAISENYRRYLATTFHFQDAHLQEQFESALAEPGRFVKGPILEATPPFAPGCSPAGLIAEGVLSSGLGHLSPEALPPDRPLYRHQEQAIRKLVSEGRNIVVATGTGSGKTEAFLIPILNHLLRGQETGTLRPGVRALLLYPMNALANDQLARLRGLLAGCPAITFGRYTGETKNEEREALEVFRRMYSSDPLSNELISRWRMRQSPPHILLTNYAMLEYLLLRPDDNAFFDGEFASKWRFLVLDEAHTYGGAKGIEMAMLLRRLKDRVVRPGARLQCIATSATLGRGVEDFPDVARFASRIFGEPVEWVPGDPSRQDVVQATRLPLAAVGDAGWQPPTSLYQKMQRVLSEQNRVDRRLPGMKATAQAAGAPEAVLRAAEPALQQGSWRAFQYELLRGDGNLVRLREALVEGPRPLDELAHEVFGEGEAPRQALVALVDLAAQARPESEGAPLLPARYHLFVRAIEGAYVALHPDRPLYLEREESVAIGGQDYAAFEVGACVRCGATYLVSETRPVDGRDHLCQPGRRYEENPRSLEFYLLGDTASQAVPDNEDEEVVAEMTQPDEAGEWHQLCPSCGAIDRTTLIGRLCDCPEQAPFTVERVPAPQGIVTHCLACGSRSPVGLVRRLLTGNDATASVLATALYQQIPPHHAQPEAARVAPVDDGWGVAFAPGEEVEAPQTGEGRKLLVFSDSRQDAAFFAPYLQRSYEQILRRRLILRTIEDNREQALANEWGIADLANALRRPVGESGLLGPNATLQQAQDEAWRWLLYELLALDRRNSLEALGLLGFALPPPPGWQAPPPLTQGWGLRQEEVLTLFRVLLDGLRLRSAVLFPDGVAPQDELFHPRNNEFFFRCSGPDARHRVMAWHPGTRLNSRLDYLLRLASQGLGRNLSREECLQALCNIWGHCLAPGNAASPWARYFSSANVPQVGPAFRLRYDCWQLQPGNIEAGVQWYQCDTCRSLTLHNLRGVCPTYRCCGRLHHCDPAEVYAGNHYRQLYASLRPIGLRSEEHTAQLTGERAAELQTQFMRGEVQVISCSTTFELGVDVGELESVFMRNVPPSATNYVQRAGRAGRRTDSAAFALTFAQRRPHDIAHFREPERMVSGRIGAPHFELANEKIARRHVHAVALAAFWRERRDAFAKVETMFFAREGEAEAALRRFLERRPEPLRAALARILPTDLAERLGVAAWGWLDGLLGPEGALTRAAEQMRAEVRQLEEARTRLIQAHQPADYVLHIINAIKRRDIISFLSAHGVLPKYGFPVDVVPLQILHHGDEAKGLDLDRDLRIALSEYAPSGEIVAGGKLWTSRYIKRLPERLWTSYDYSICPHCHRYQRVLAGTGQRLETCIACGSPLRGRERGTFIIPEFGFIADLEPPRRPGESRPERTYSSRTYYSGEGKASEPLRLEAPGGAMLAQSVAEGLLAVVNSAGGQGFQVCCSCGYALLGGERASAAHKTPWRTDCRGRLAHYHLGHEYKTDVLLLRFQHSDGRPGFWPSLLYGLLEGSADALDVDRADIDGCLYPWDGDPLSQALVLFDNVPGGAGHVRRLAESPERLRAMLARARQMIEACECGGEEGDTSCYGCLRNYRNQFYHDELKRGLAMGFLRQLGV